MYRNYKDMGLQILGFPCGQFMGQELATEAEIQDFISKKFEVDFPMFSKISANGPTTHPIYKYLKSNCEQMRDSKGLKNVPWNFGKFLVNSQGKVLGFYGPSIKPNQILKEIEPILKGESLI
jgi:glutathione peroxidase